MAAIQILVVLEGFGAHTNTDRSHRPGAVTTMAVSTAERVLNMPVNTVVALTTGAGVLRAGPREIQLEPAGQVPRRSP